MSIDTELEDPPSSNFARTGVICSANTTIDRQCKYKIGSLQNIPRGHASGALQSGNPSFSESYPSCIVI